LFASNLGGKNLGIVGLGRIGQKVTQIAQAIGMKVAAYDPYIEHSMFQALNVEPQGFMELLRNSDVLSLHVPLTKETFEMINAKTLVEANTDLILINASRGQVIREPDLIQWLQKKKIKAAGLDVYHKEPLVKDSELKQLKNVFLTPHIGAFTEEAYVEASEDAVAKALRFIDSGELRDELPLDQAWAKFL